MGHGLGAWMRAAATAVLVASAAGLLAAGAGVGATSRAPAMGGTGPTGEGPVVEGVASSSGRVAPMPEPTGAVGSGDRPIEPPPDHFEGPLPPPAPLPPALRHPSSSGSPTGVGVWAVIVGINDYPGARNDLRSAVADAADVDEALARYGVPARQRLVLRDRQATAEVIRAAAGWLVGHAGPAATAVFFYAGHVRKIGPGREAIVGADGRVVTDDELAARLAGLAAGEMWIGMAACYGGGFTELLRPGRVLTAAAGASEIAYENEKFGRSYLVEYMVRRAMIEGAAPASVQATFSWARDAISRDYPSRVPVIVDASDGDVRLGQARSVPEPARDRPVPQPPGAGGTPASPPPSQPNRDGPDGCAGLTMGLVRCG